MNAGKQSVRRKITGRRMLLATALILCAVLAVPCFSHAAGLKVNLHKYGTCTDCGDKRGDGKNDWKIISYDNGAGATSYRWVEFSNPVTGKKEKNDAYCLQPVKSTPGEGKKSASLIKTDGSKKMQNLAKVLYFADGGPGKSALKKYLENHKKAYPDMQSGKQRFALMHILLGYAYGGEDAFKVTWNNGNPNKASSGKLSASYRGQVKKIYQWCLQNAVFASDAAFGFSPARVNAEYRGGAYVSQTITVTGDDGKQYFTYKVPAKASLRVTHKGGTKTYGAGKTANIYVGDRMVFTFDGNRSSGIPKTTVTGALSKLMPYVIKSSDKQDIGFYAGTDAARAAFTVTLARPAAGQTRISKEKESISGDTSPEADAVFRVWNAAYTDYDSARAAGTAQQRYADELVTGTDGTALSEELAPGTYKVEQVGAPTGILLMDPNPQTVQVSGDKTVLLELTDREAGIRIRLRKVDAGTGEPITGASASFGIYSDEECSELVTQCASAPEGEDAGTAVSAPLSPGVYYIREIHAPEGYRASSRTVKAILEYSSRTKVSDTEFLYDAGDFENSRPEFHDVIVNKRVSSGEDGVFTFDVSVAGITEEDGVSVELCRSGEAPQQVPVSTEGHAISARVHLSAGESFCLRHLPVGAEYRITENAAEGYRPSFAASPRSAVTVPDKTGRRSEELSVSETIRPQAKAGPDGYSIQYDWDNSQEVLHTLLVGKTCIGAGRNEDDEFGFRVEFAGLGGKIPGYEIFCTEDGELLNSCSPGEGDSDLQAFDIRLRDGQSVRFTGIPPGAEYEITERGSTYAPSYQVLREEGEIGRTEALGKACEDLSTGKNRMPEDPEKQGNPENNEVTGDKEVEYRFVNAAPPPPPTNALLISKSAQGADGSRDAGEEFTFTAFLQGLEKNATYSLVKDGGDTTAFASDGAGEATVEFRLKRGECAQILNLPAACRYRVTEHGNRFEPSYEILRQRESGMEKLDSDTGGTGQDLGTGLQTMPDSNTQDHVEFINRAQTQTLRVSKTQEGGTARSFPFTALFTGLPGEHYLAVLPGQAQAHLRAGSGGTISISIQGSEFFQRQGGDLSGIPVKIIRGDGEARTLLTDAEGVIPGAEYTGWIMEHEDSHEYRLEFLGCSYINEW